MAGFPSYRVTVTRPMQIANGTETYQEYRTVARDVACEIYSDGFRYHPALLGSKVSQYAQAVISPRADVRYGDRLIEPSGQNWDVDNLIRSDLACRCVLRRAEG